MSWRCGGKTNLELVENLARAAIVSLSPRPSAPRCPSRCPSRCLTHPGFGLCAGPPGLWLLLTCCWQIKEPRVIAAMTAVDRAAYCPTKPYVDSPQRIGFNATISAPHMHAYALECKCYTSTLPQEFPPGPVPTTRDTGLT